MRGQVTGAAGRVTLFVLAASVAVFSGAPMAEAAGNQLKPIVITPSSGCGLLTAYAAGAGLPAWSGPAPSCGAGAFTLAFNQGNTPPPARLARRRDGRQRSVAGLAPHRGARRGKDGVPDHRPAGNHDQQGGVRHRPVAEHRRWVRLDRPDLLERRHRARYIRREPRSTRLPPAPLNTTYWGIELRCVQSVCTWPGTIQLNQFTVSATEASGPSITPVADPGSLWDQAGWIWNPPGDAWSLPVAGADWSGLCSMSVQAGVSPPITDPSLPAPNNSSWQECQQPVRWTATVDTREFVSGAGQLPVTLQATNAAALPNAPMSETLNVDNDPVTVSLSTPDDPNPTVWVNHAVTVDATPSTGPSGLGRVTCSVDGAAAQSYPAGGLTVDGDGVKTVSCTAWNNAVDPQGNHNSGTSSVTVHIDEAPPVVSLEPVNPNDPTALVADTSDSESGVAGGSVEIAPAGTGTWTSLPDDVHRQPAAGALQRRGSEGPRTRSRSRPATTSGTAPQRLGR